MDGIVAQKYGNFPTTRMQTNAFNIVNAESRIPDRKVCALFL
jgi:hypothetical protein